MPSSDDWKSSANERNALYNSLRCVLLVFRLPLVAMKCIALTNGIPAESFDTSSLMRRIQRRMQQIPLTTFVEYEDYLQVHPEEFSQLFNTILINVTDFFRDPEAWAYLQQKVIPRILENKSNNEPIRIWSAGCASGQEPYTLAMVFAETMGEKPFRERVKIYATDADEEALTQARAATYSSKQVQAAPEALLEKYFEATKERYTFRNDLRRAVIFGRHDLVQDAPISRLDLLVCRNTLMYFTAETQANILGRLHSALNAYGYLFLGKSEMMMARSTLFYPLNLKYRIFSKLTNGALREGMVERTQGDGVDADTHIARQIRLREAAIDAAPLAQIVIDPNGVVILVNERARSQFGISPKDVGRPLQDLEISYRPVELRSLIDQAYAERRVIALNDIQRHPPGGETQYLDLQVAPLPYDGDTVLGTIITYIDVSQAHRLQQELRHTAQDLETACEELQSANEELETTNEELQSANEELETTNEELQSANEELETMNEELQSSNEELHTVNDELRQRTDEFNRINAWLQAVLQVQPLTLIVIDPNLDVLLWNQRAEEMWGLRAEEVRGKALFSLDIGLPVAQLRDLIRACLNEQVNQTTVVVDAINRRGKAIQCQVTLSPFGEHAPPENGVTLLIEDITEREQLMKAIAKNQSQ